MKPGHSTDPFQSLGLSRPLAEAVRALGFQTPTEIQRASLPTLLAGKDLVGQSKTGSGKTAAFGLPLLQRIDLTHRAPQSLVLCPTRELCAQVARELRSFGVGLEGLRIVELVGGQPAKPQRETLGRGAHVIVGTPGRVADHLRRGSLEPGGIRNLVLDEADRMLDMGFGQDVRGIVGALPRQRQSALFSATFPTEIEAMCREVLVPGAARVAASEDDGLSTLGSIRQFRIEAPAPERFDVLCRVLAEFSHDSAIVFCNFKATVASLTASLRSAGLSADRLDGDLDQFHRDQVLARFRAESLRILVATDVAGRGIDIDGLDLVVNYELPPQPEIYVHRTGRTGRAGKDGVAVSMTRGRSDPIIDDIEAATGQPLQYLRLGTSAPIQDVIAGIARPPKMATILISGGRKDKIRRGDILGALTGDAGGLDGKDVGKIEVQERLSYVAVTASLGPDATTRLNAGRIKGKRYRATLT